MLDRYGSGAFSIGRVCLRAAQSGSNCVRYTLADQKPKVKRDSPAMPRTIRPPPTRTGGPGKPDCLTISKGVCPRTLREGRSRNARMESRGEEPLGGLACAAGECKAYALLVLVAPHRDSRRSVASRRAQSAQLGELCHPGVDGRGAHPTGKTYATPGGQAGTPASLNYRVILQQVVSEFLDDGTIPRIARSHASFPAASPPCEVWRRRDWSRG